MKFCNGEKCKCCRNCPYFYNEEFCLLEQDYVEDMWCCPSGEQFGDGNSYLEDNYGNKIYSEDLHVIRKY